MNEKNDILIVDDEIENVRLLAELLEQEGYSVWPAYNARSAIDAALAQPPGLILLEVRMPEIDGFEVCRRLKQDIRTRNVPIIFVSALSDLETRVQAFEAGGVDFITKPFQELELLARVKTHMRLHKVQQELVHLAEERTLRYRMFLDHSLEAIWCVEFDEPIDLSLPEEEQFELVFKHAYVAEVNNAYAKHLGIENENEMVGTRFGDFLSRSDPTNVATVKAWIRGRYTIKDVETVESYKDGVTRIVLNNAIGIIESGHVVQVWGTHTDITDNKEAERKLLEAEQKYRTVADYTFDWECWEAPNGSFIYVSPSCERITQYGVSDFLERPNLFSEIIVPEDKEIWDTHHHGETTDTAKISCRFRIKRKDGQIRWIAHVCQPVFNADGDFDGIRSSNRDITELQRAESQASEHLSMLANLDRRATLGQLTGSIAHELNQPLTGILGGAQAGEMLLEGETVDKTQIREILSDIVSDTKRASQVIKNLRELFKGQLVELESMDMNTLIKETIQLLNSEFISHVVTVHMNLDPQLPEITANRIQIQQILINLLKNACQSLQSSAQEKRKLSIETTQVNENQIELCLADNGMGIDPEHLDSVFEPLLHTKEQGMGMGLAICKTIVRAHGGSISVKNIPEGGAIFHISLPIQR